MARKLGFFNFSLLINKSAYNYLSNCTGKQNDEEFVTIAMRKGVKFDDVVPVMDTALVKTWRKILNDLSEECGETATEDTIVCNMNLGGEKALCFQANQPISESIAVLGTAAGEQLFKLLFPISDKYLLVLVDESGAFLYETCSNLTGKDAFQKFILYPNEADSVEKIYAYISRELKGLLDSKQFACIVLGVNENLWHSWEMLKWPFRSVNVHHFCLRQDTITLGSLVDAAGELLKGFAIAEERRSLNSFYSSGENAVCRGIARTLKALQNGYVEELLVSTTLARTVYKVQDPLQRIRYAVSEKEGEKGIILHDGQVLEVLEKEHIYSFLKRIVTWGCAVTPISEQLGNDFQVEMGLGGILHHWAQGFPADAEEDDVFVV